MSPERFHSDRELVAGCLSGDSGAWEQFIETYSPVVERSIASTLRRFSHPSGLIADLSQETFAAFAHPEASPLLRFRWECALAQLVSVVSIRKTLAFLKRRRMEEGIAQSLSLLNALTAADEAGADALNREERCAKLHQALGELGPRERLAIQLSYWHAQPAERIGWILGLSANAARQVLHQARRRLRELIRALPCVL